MARTALGLMGGIVRRGLRLCRYVVDDEPEEPESIARQIFLERVRSTDCYAPPGSVHRQPCDQSSEPTPS